MTSANLPLIPLSLSLPKSFSSASLIFSIKPDNFLAATKIPPPASPAKISPSETFSEIHLNTVLIVSQIVPATFLIVSPIAEIVPCELLVCSTMLEKKLEILLETVAKSSLTDPIPVNDLMNSTTWSLTTLNPDASLSIAPLTNSTNFVKPSPDFIASSMDTIHSPILPVIPRKPSPTGSNFSSKCPRICPNAFSP